MGSGDKMIEYFSETFDGVELTCGICGGTVVYLGFEKRETKKTPEGDALWVQVKTQLSEYFSGARREFDLPHAPQGTAFQMQVWEALRAIPYGETRTYGEIARAIGRPKAARAVGMACHVNPIAVIVPCHRVVGSTGGLTGYAGGLPVKERLLALEKGITAF